MRYIICYDIKSPKVWRKVFKKLKAYGIRTQYSVFETDLPEEIVIKIIREIGKIVEDDDKVFAFRVHNEKRIIRIGGEDLLKKNSF